MWENMKYFGALITALITASVTLIGFNFQFGNNVFFLILIIILQLFIIYLAEYAKRDLRERKKRFFEIISHLLKLEVILGFYEDISKNLKGTRFEKDKYLFDDFQKNLVIDQSVDKTKVFAEEKTSASYRFMSRVYLIMQFTVGALIIAEVVFIPRV